MNWMEAAQQSASGHPTIVGLRASAKRHHQESENFLVHSVNAMRGHELLAQHLEATATYLETEFVVKAGVAAGEWKTYLVGHNREVGKYIQVQTEQGWSPDYFWCEDPGPVTADSAALM